MCKQPLRLLLADDDADERYIMHQAFNEIGWCDGIKMFDSAEELLRYMQVLPQPYYPALIVLDYNMPKVSGAEALSLLKRNKAFANIQVVIYSSLISNLTQTALSNIGAAGCYKKACDFSEAVALATEFKRMAEGCLVNPAHLTA